MPKKSITVEVNPDILKWAIGSSGWNEQEISKKLKLSSNIFDSWLKGETNPTLRQLEDLAKTVAEMFGDDIKIEKTTGPTDAYASADPKRRCPDISRIKAKLGYEPKIELKTGIKRFVEWAREAQL